MNSSFQSGDKRAVHAGPTLCAPPSRPVPVTQLLSANRACRGGGGPSRPPLVRPWRRPVREAEVDALPGTSVDHLLGDLAPVVVPVGGARVGRAVTLIGAGASGPTNAVSTCCAAPAYPPWPQTQRPDGPLDIRRLSARLRLRCLRVGSATRRWCRRARARRSPAREPCRSGPRHELEGGRRAPALEGSGTARPRRVGSDGARCECRRRPAIRSPRRFPRRSRRRPSESRRSESRSSSAPGRPRPVLTWGGRRPPYYCGERSLPRCGRGRVPSAPRSFGGQTVAAGLRIGGTGTAVCSA